VVDHHHAWLTDAAAQRAHQTARLARGDAVADGRRHARERAVGHARRIDRDDAVGAQKVLRLVVQDEALQRRGEQQDADRGALHGAGGYWRDGRRPG
jgi:hypothetical protein